MSAGVVCDGEKELRLHGNVPGWRVKEDYEDIQQMIILTGKRAEKGKSFKACG